jgi:hypothetical protein
MAGVTVVTFVPELGDFDAWQREAGATPQRQPQKKKAAWFPRRPFLSYGSSTLSGDFRTSAPGAYLPAVS